MASFLLSFDYQEEQMGKNQLFDADTDPFDFCIFNSPANNYGRSTQPQIDHSLDILDPGTVDAVTPFNKTKPTCFGSETEEDLEPELSSNRDFIYFRPQHTDLEDEPDMSKPQTPSNLSKRAPVFDSSNEDDSESGRKVSSKEPKKISYLNRCSNNPSHTHSRKLMLQVKEQWESIRNNHVNFIGKVREMIRGIFLDHKFVHPQDVENPAARLILHQLYSTIIPNYDPENPTATEPRASSQNVLLMDSKRSDQYVKKFWSKLKVIIYGKFKNENNKRAEALEELKEKFGFKREDTDTFLNLFGGNVKHGLKKSTIEFILSHPKLFKLIFTKNNFEKVLGEMDQGSEKDTETNILDKLEVFAEKVAPDFNMLETDISDERKFKKPFTRMENNLSAIQFLDKFLKRIKKLHNISAEKRADIEKSLFDLKKYLEKRAKDSKWTPPFKFKKSEIISFLTIPIHQK